MIQIDASRCIGCGLCVGDCFPAALSLEQNKARFTVPENCIGCGHCIAICPQNAVTDDALPMDDLEPLTDFQASEPLLGLMRSRRSCRHYQNKPIPQKTIDMLLSAIRACPTAKNLQDTRCILVREKIPQLLNTAISTLGKIGTAQKNSATDAAELRRAENFIRWEQLRRDNPDFDPLFFHAPMLLLFISDRNDPRDAAAAAAYGELMAAALGLGCLYSGYFTACAAGNSEISTILELAPGEQVVRCLVLGYPDVRFQRTAPRKPLNVTEL